LITFAAADARSGVTLTQTVAENKFTETTRKNEYEIDQTKELCPAAGCGLIWDWCCWRWPVVAASSAKMAPCLHRKSRGRHHSGIVALQRNCRAHLIRCAWRRCARGWTALFFTGNFAEGAEVTNG